MEFVGDSADDTRIVSMHVSLPNWPPIKIYGENVIPYRSQVITGGGAFPPCLDQVWEFCSEICTTYSNRACKDTFRLPSLTLYFFIVLIDFAFVFDFWIVRSLEKKKRKRRAGGKRCRLLHDISTLRPRFRSKFVKLIGACQIDRSLHRISDPQKLVPDK